MSPEDSDSRPAGNGPASKSLNDDNSNGTKHGAVMAADARPWYVDLAWDLAIRNGASTGKEFGADDLQRVYDLPDAGNAVGGFFMRAHRAGIIRRTGYRPSRRAARSGGVISTWVGVS